MSPEVPKVLEEESGVCPIELVLIRKGGFFKTLQGKRRMETFTARELAEEYFPPEQPIPEEAERIIGAEAKEVFKQRCQAENAGGELDDWLKGKERVAIRKKVQEILQERKPNLLSRLFRRW